MNCQSRCAKYSECADEFPYNEENQHIEFTKDEIVLELIDKDETRTLFGFVF